MRSPMLFLDAFSWSILSRRRVCHCSICSIWCTLLNAIYCNVMFSAIQCNPKQLKHQSACVQFCNESFHVTIFLIIFPNIIVWTLIILYISTLRLIYSCFKNQFINNPNVVFSKIDNKLMLLVFDSQFGLYTFEKFTSYVYINYQQQIG